MCFPLFSGINKNNLFSVAKVQALCAFPYNTLHYFEVEAYLWRSGNSIISMCLYYYGFIFYNLRSSFPHASILVTVMGCRNHISFLDVPGVESHHISGQTDKSLPWWSRATNSPQEWCHPTLIFSGFHTFSLFGRKTKKGNPIVLCKTYYK